MDCLVEQSKTLRLANFQISPWLHDLNMKPQASPGMTNLSFFGIFSTLESHCHLLVWPVYCSVLTELVSVADDHRNLNNRWPGRSGSHR